MGPPGRLGSRPHRRYVHELTVVFRNAHSPHGLSSTRRGHASELYVDGGRCRGSEPPLVPANAQLPKEPATRQMVECRKGLCQRDRVVLCRQADCGLKKLGEGNNRGQRNEGSRRSFERSAIWLPPGKREMRESGCSCGRGDKRPQCRQRRAAVGLGRAHCIGPSGVESSDPHNRGGVCPGPIRSEADQRLGRLSRTHVIAHLFKPITGTCSSSLSSNRSCCPTEPISTAVWPLLIKSSP